MTVVTAVLNGERWLRRCIESVRHQSYPHTRHLVIDGGSSDGTISILEAYSGDIWKWLSEPDSGHFDAMNKGVELAEDGYLLFLNSDDYLVADHTLSSTIAKATSGQTVPQIIAGSVAFSYEGQLRPGWKWPVDRTAAFRYGLAHQATLIQRDLCRAYPYDRSFPLTADQRFWRSVRARASVDLFWVDDSIAVFELGGLSTDPQYEAARALEAAYASYLGNRRTSVLSLVRRLTVARGKVLLHAAVGDRAYHLWVLRSVNWLRSNRQARRGLIRRDRSA